MGIIEKIKTYNTVRNNLVRKYQLGGGIKRYQEGKKFTADDGKTYTTADRALGTRDGKTGVINYGYMQTPGNMELDPGFPTEKYAEKIKQLQRGEIQPVMEDGKPYIYIDGQRYGVGSSFEGMNVPDVSPKGIEQTSELLMPEMQKVSPQMQGIAGYGRLYEDEGGQHYTEEDLVRMGEESTLPNQDLKVLEYQGRRNIDPNKVQSYKTQYKQMPSSSGKSFIPYGNVKQHVEGNIKPRLAAQDAGFRGLGSGVSRQSTGQRSVENVRKGSDTMWGTGEFEKRNK